MTTLNHIIYQIRDLLKLSSDDSTITNDHIKYLINNERSRFVKQYLNDSKKRIPSAWRQEIKLSLETNASQGFSDKKFLKSIESIPDLISTQSHYNINTLSSDNEIIKNFSMTSYKRLPYIGLRRGMQNIVYGAISDSNILYLVSGNDKIMFLNNIKLSGVFDNPEEAWELTSDYSSAIDFEDADYPIEASMVDLIIQEVVKLLSVRFEILEDTINNAREDTQG